MPCSAAGGDVMGSGLSYHSPAATLCVLPPAPSSFRSEEGGPRAGYKLKRRPGRGTSPGRKRYLYSGSSDKVDPGEVRARGVSATYIPAL